jgi:hypothetical protein
MRLILITLLFITISSCGFKPILAKGDSGYKVLTTVKLASVDGPEKFRLKRIVEEVFDNDLRHNFKYDLKISFSFNNFAIGVMKDTQITRYRIVSTLNYVLVGLEDNKVLNEGAMSLNGSYDAAESDFANYISGQKVSDELTKELTKELVGRLSLVIADIEGREFEDKP